LLSCIQARRTGQLAQESAEKPLMPQRSLISIIEDDQPFRDSMRKLLTSLGYAVEAFPSAAAFLASPLVAQTSCLVSDVQMPGMTGIELHRHLTNAGYAIPTILVTAYPDEIARRRALKHGILCYLPKPVDDEHLERCLRSALDGRKPHEEPS
jgi:FixJ family two-component response regulator